VLKDIIMTKRGLVIMVGATGSGKSTTLAAMIGFRNENSQGHIITIEDPIEFTHPHRGCLITQREVGVDTLSWGHALKNTLVPVITITGLQLGAIIAFAIITETVFQWPGMGLLFIQAVQFADIPVMAAYLCLIALFFVVINLVVDLLYYAVDPRLRVERANAAA